MSLDEFHELAKGLLHARGLERIRLRCRHKAPARDDVDAERGATLHGKHARAVESVANKFETTMVGSQLSKAIAAVIRGHAAGEGQSRKGGLKELELGCSVGTHGLSRIGAAIAKGASLTRLNLTGARIGDAGFKLLASGIRANPSIAELVLSCCGLTDATAEAIAAVLRSHASRLAVARWQTNLREYATSSGRRREADDNEAFSRTATAGGAASVGPYSGATGLSLLDVSNNSLTDASLAVLCATLEQDELLRTLIIGGNLFTEHGRAALRAVETSRVPRLEVEYDENDDDRARERELARRRRFMASTLARIRTHATPEKAAMPAPAQHVSRPFAETSNTVQSTAKSALSARPRWSMGKAGTEPRRIAKPIKERSPLPAAKSSRGRQQQQPRTQVPREPHEEQAPERHRRRRTGDADEKSLSVMMDDMTSLLARLESSVATLNAGKERKSKKKKKKGRDDEGHGVEGGETTTTEERDQAATTGVDSDSIQRLNERLTSIYGIQY